MEMTPEEQKAMQDYLQRRSDYYEQYPMSTPAGPTSDDDLAEWERE